MIALMNSTRRTFLMTLPGAAGVMAQSPDRRPNILILLTVPLANSVCVGIRAGED